MLGAFSILFLTLFLGGGVDGGSLSRGRPDLPSRPRAFAVATEPPVSEVRVGDPAPNFSYQGFDGRWMKLHHLLDQGPVLLVFGPGEGDLRRLEAQREWLLDLGVIPVAVVDLMPGSARTMANRIGLRYTVLADQRRVIASQFNLVETGRLTPSWFAIDNHGKVRGLARGRLPLDDYTRLCARALALPLPGVAFPTGSGSGTLRRLGRR